MEGVLIGRDALSSHSRLGCRVYEIIVTSSQNRLKPFVALGLMV